MKNGMVKGFFGGLPSSFLSFIFFFQVKAYASKVCLGLIKRLLSAFAAAMGVVVFFLPRPPLPPPLLLPLPKRPVGRRPPQSRG